MIGMRNARYSHWRPSPPVENAGAARTLADKAIGAVRGDLHLIIAIQRGEAGIPVPVGDRAPGLGEGVCRIGAGHHHPPIHKRPESIRRRAYRTTYGFVFTPAEPAPVNSPAFTNTG
jgi:hypothetical protein